MRSHLRHFTTGLGSPQGLCGLLEALVAERRLTWRACNPVVEKILARTGPTGNWQ